MARDSPGRGGPEHEGGKQSLRGRLGRAVPGLHDGQPGGTRVGRPGRASGDPAASLGGEGGEVARGGAGHVWADRDQRLDGVAGAVDLAAAGRDAGGEEAAVEGDALVAEGVALVDGDGDGRQALEVGGGREVGPGERVAAAVGVGEREGVEEVAGEEDAVVLDGGGEVGVGPAAGDEGAQGVYSPDEVDAAFRFKLQADSKSQVTPATVARNNDAGWIHSECGGITVQPFETGHTIIQAGRERRHVWNGRRQPCIAEVNHIHSRVVLGKSFFPCFIELVEAGSNTHCPAMDEVYTRYIIFSCWANDLNFYQITIFFRYKTKN